MNIILINKEVFQNRPPVISTLLSLSDLGHQIDLITVGVNDYWTEILNKRNISIHVIREKENKSSKIEKIIEYIHFRIKVFSLVKSITKEYPSSLLWVIGGNTIWCLGKGLLKYNFVLQIQELHEYDKKYLSLFKKIINEAKLVFVNEYNRAIIYQCWFKMNKRPVVIPNKPFFIDVNKEYDLSSYLDNSILTRLKNNKVILFQGQIVDYRDLSPYIEAAKQLGGYQIVLLGNEYGMVDKYRKIDNTLIYIKRVPAPQYLGITSMAHICLVTYDEHALNNAYCAPNKIYEYGAYSKPMIGNDIPGLMILESKKSGIIVDEKNIDSIKNAIIEIENNYSLYSEGARSLFESVNNKKTIQDSLNSIYEE